METDDPERRGGRVLRELGLTDVADRSTAAVSRPCSATRAGKVCAALVHAGVGVRGFAVAAPSLEDVFVALTGEGFDVSG